MANKRKALDVENPTEGSVTGHRKPKTTTALYAPIKGIRDEQGKFLPIWNMIFVMSCVFAVSLDPLFFYILIIDQDKKCLQMDKMLSTTVLVLRSLTDIILAVHFIYNIYDGIKVQKNKDLPSNPLDLEASSIQQTETSIHTGGKLDWKSKGRVLIESGKKIAQKMSWLSFSIINDFLALLPVPQLLIVVTFYKSAGYLEQKKVLNALLFSQYLPRIYRIQLSSTELRKNAGIWVKGLFNFFLYILASHILGAFWYLFSIQRETSCWHSACAKHSPDFVGCMNTFYCERRTTTSRNITFLSEHCSIDTPDGALAPFDFGIFLDSLKNHNSEHIKFGKKFLYSFWWGLRNISNFGTNLTTSTYVWENLFAILISVIGLLLFLYLIGNVQTLMQLEATKSEEIRQNGQTLMQLEATKSEEIRQYGQTLMQLKATISEEKRRKIRMKKLDVRQWISENKFPDDIKNEILNSIEQALKKNRHADVHKPFLILPWETKRSVKRYLFMDTLKTVKKLQDVGDKVLTSMCDCLTPVSYTENSFVFRTGDPLHCMLFIIEGQVLIYASSDSQAGQGISTVSTNFLGKGDFYGEELLDCASDGFRELPVSSKNVKCLTKVEALVLMTKDLETVVSKYPLQWRKSEKVSQKVKDIAASTIAKAFRRYLCRHLHATKER